MYILDTDTCSYIIKKKPLSVKQRLDKIPVGNVVVSVITVAELRYGIEKLGAKRFTQSAVDDFLRYVRVSPWDEEIAPFYARLRNYLTKQGTLIGNMDLMIAAHALCYDYTLVTNNTRHFSLVPDLNLENWLED